MAGNYGKTGPHLIRTTHIFMFLDIHLPILYIFTYYILNEFLSTAYSIQYKDHSQKTMEDEHDSLSLDQCHFKTTFLLKLCTLS